jgi:hypothetical protein
MDSALEFDTGSDGHSLTIFCKLKLKGAGKISDPFAL